MNWKRTLLAVVTWKKYQTFLADTQAPEDARARLWNKEIVPLIKRSAYWQKIINFDEVPLLDNVEISTYETYEPLLTEALNSHTQPFNLEQIIFWSETSATSGKRKYFPITKSFQTQFQRTMAPYFYSLMFRYPAFLQKKILYLAAYNVDQESAAGIPMGLISHFNYRNLPSLIKSFYALPIEVFSSGTMFYQWAPLYALTHDLSAIFAITPMAIDSFYKLCAENFAMYHPYLLGLKTVPSPLPPLNISKERQKYLHALDKNEIHSYSTLWPSLTLSGCWISGLCEQYAQQLSLAMGPEIALVDGTYSATEGWMTVPIDSGHRGGVLHPGAHIVEFIKEGNEIHKENILQSWQLKEGERYEVFLTTAMGFVRYQLKDIVLCTGYFNRAPRLEFCCKSSQIRLDACSISEQEIQKMLAALNFKMEPYWYFARNTSGNKLILVIDIENQLPEEILGKMHEQLIKLSETYAYGVSLDSVKEPDVHQLPKEQLLGSRHAQTKPKLISQQIIDLK